MNKDNVINLDGEGIDKTPKKRTVKPAKEQGSMADRLADLLKNSSSDYYSFTLPSGKEIQIRPTIFEDERQAAIESAQKGTSIIQALERRVVKGVDVSKLPYFDELFILLKMRQVSFGPKIELNPIPCVHCGEINHGLVVEIDKLYTEIANPPLTSLSVEVDLPITGNRVLARIPSIAEDELDGISTRNDNIYRLVENISGETDTHIIKAFMEKAPVADVKAIKQAIFNHGYGVDTTVNFNCSHCGKLNSVELPLTSDFLPLS